MGLGHGLDNGEEQAAINLSARLRATIFGGF